MTEGGLATASAGTFSGAWYAAMVKRSGPMHVPVLVESAGCDSWERRA